MLSYDDKVFSSLIDCLIYILINQQIFEPTIFLMLAFFPFYLHAIEEKNEKYADIVHVEILDISEKSSRVVVLLDELV